MSPARSWTTEPSATGLMSIVWLRAGRSVTGCSG
jgi:hypothetical protein